MRSHEEKKGIGAVMILEIIGRPKEYLLENLSEIITKIGAEKGVSVIEKKIREPTLIKDQKDLFTTFAEVEVEADEVVYLAVLMFKYMPSHIEVIYPEEIKVDNSTLTDLFSELCRRLHGYDEIARVLSVEKNILEKKLREIMAKSQADESPSIKMEATASRKPKAKKKEKFVVSEEKDEGD